jgi:hypothetical protein
MFHANMYFKQPLEGILMSVFASARALHQSLQEKWAQLSEYKKHAHILYAVEARYTLLCLDRILQNYQNQFMPDLLVDFFKDRWNWIKNSDIQYCHDYYNPANVMCIEIAKVLSRELCRPYLLLLMPTLAAIPDDWYITSSYSDENLDLKDIIISDDNQRLISVTDVLSFAKDDGKLKYNSLFNNASKELDVGDHHRLLSRHASVYNYFQTLQDKLNFVLHGENAGAYLARLIIGLREGGKNKKGTEMIAGYDANVAIVDFKRFLDSLGREKEKQVLSMSKFDRTTTSVPIWFSIRRSWERLAHGKEVTGDTAVYCVELIAYDLEEILQENPSLYNIVPFNSDSIANLQQLNANIEHCLATMTDALNTSNQFAYYDSQNNPAFILNVCSKIAQSPQISLDTHDIVYFSRLYHQCKHSMDLGHAATRLACKSILLSTRNHCSKIKIKLALDLLPSEVAAEVKGLLTFAANPSIVSNRSAFHSRIAEPKRKLISDEPADNKKVKNDSSSMGYNL